MIEVKGICINGSKVDFTVEYKGEDHEVNCEGIVINSTVFPNYVNIRNGDLKIYTSCSIHLSRETICTCFEVFDVVSKYYDINTSSVNLRDCIDDELNINICNINLDGVDLISTED